MNEQARVISGEEEAAYGWASVNFLMGALLENSKGQGTVVDPRLTYGALDLGGASTQISFYEPGEDIMSNLFKLQIGQAKHWNVYAHSFLRYGVNEAQERMRARLSWDKTVQERFAYGVHDPCLPGGSHKDFRSAVTFDKNGVEVLDKTLEPYSAIMVNDNDKGSWEECSGLVYQLLRKDSNAWCNYAHGGDCSFSGVYQPSLPLQSKSFGEFLGFSNFNHVWKFLQLPERSSLSEMLSETQHICSMSREELLNFNDGFVNDDVAEEYCFRAVYVFHLLHNGYGFPLDYNITATNVINGQKVGWALGAMLYEINTLPWNYETKNHHGFIQNMKEGWKSGEKVEPYVLFLMVATMVGLLLCLFKIQWNRKVQHGKAQYEPIDNCSGIEMESEKKPHRSIP